MKERIHQLFSEPEKLLFEIAGNITDDEAEKIIITSKWNLADTVSHLLSWVEEFDREIRHIAKDGTRRLPWSVSTRNNYSEWNHAQLEKRKGSSLSELHSMFRHLNRDLEDFVLSLPYEKLRTVTEILWYYPPDLTIPDIISVKSHHEMCHLKKIEEALRRGR
ncbi:MAG: ClbS/DfsB family four-helix bundle protein [Candidatus Xenobiia bacterium LiM19]